MRINLPDLSGAKAIAFDLETKDDGLAEKKGPGGVHGHGYILGVAVAVDGWQEYISINHPDTDNMPEEPTLAWLRKQLGNPNQVKVGANILYDLEWLRWAGVEVYGRLFDTHVAEPLIDENQRRYNLEAMSQKYLAKKYWKQKDNMEEIVTEILGKCKGDPRAHLWQLPARAVRDYAIADAVATLRVAYAQKKILKEMELECVFDVEMRLVPMLLDMRFKGVRIDESRVEEVRDQIIKQQVKAQKVLNKTAGCEVNVNAAASIARAFDNAGIEYPRTAKTKAPSFTKEFLGAHQSPLAKQVLVVRKAHKVLSTFIEGHIMGHIHNGRIHPSFHQLRSDDSGTVSGRFSASNPNVQQIPSRDKEFAPLIRGLFIPEDGCLWWKNDWSQIEYRLIVHYACVKKLPKAHKAQEAYISDAETDFHQWAADLMQKDRRFAKDINFGLAYSMGVKKLARELGLDEDEATELFAIYHREVPFMRGLSRTIMRVAQNRGYVKTLLGRRRRFDLWEPAGTFNSKMVQALPREAAVEAHGTNLQRAHTYKSMNSVIQGSAADIMKLAMVDLYESGVFGVIGSPSLTVHDELDGSAPRTKAGVEALREIKHIMENCIKLEVPILCDAEVGENWATLQPFKGK
jgi:DNA polymerase I-like protein with 3'-5' exonuclease and polymerase domains